MAVNPPVAFKTLDWQQSLRGTPLWKQVFYRCTRPALSLLTLPHLSAEYRVGQLEYVLPARGLPLEARRKWVDRHRRIRDATVLVQGTGTGWDVVSWAAHRPRQIIAVDLFEFEEWPSVADHIRRHYGVEVTFRAAPLEDLSFLPDGSIDIAVSDAVFEHCQNLPAVLGEARRILADQGILYASYGPLWYCAGGDHFSGRGGLDTAYNHLLLAATDYHTYFESHREPIEDFQSGGRYVEIDLFSKLTTRQYLHAFKTADFRLTSLILEVSPDSLAFRNRYGAVFKRLEQRLEVNGVSADDLLIKTNLVILRK